MSGPEAVFFLFATAVAVDQSQQAQDARQQAAERRQQVQKQRNFRQRQQELRQARAARARAVAQGASSGAEIGGSSAIQGTTSSIQSQAASNISFLDELGRAGSAITDAEMDAQEHQQTANIFGSIAGSSGQIGTIFEEVTREEG